jgi:phage portal protein BeeE
VGAWSWLKDANRTPTPSVPETARYAMGDLHQWILAAQDNGTLMPFQTWGPPNQEPIGSNFADFAQRILRDVGPVWALIAVRTYAFAQAEFAFQNRVSGRLFTDKALRPLEEPWPNGTTVELCARMLVDHDLAGNCYMLNRGGRLRRLRPDRVSIVLGSPSSDPDEEPAEHDADLVGYLYQPPGKGRQAVGFLPSEVVHFSTIPDPMGWYRGLSWLTPVLNDIRGDVATTQHKLAFFRNGGTPNMVVSFDPLAFENIDEFNAAMEAMEAATRGSTNAYRTLYLRGASDVKVVGVNMRDLDMKAIQGAGESRLAAAAGVPASVVGFSEGMQGSALNSGNYGAARRRMADLTIRPLWQAAAGALSKAVVVPSDARLVVDDRRAAFAREDRRDEAEIGQAHATTIRQLVDAGYEPETVVQAVSTGDMTKLKHSGLYSVQLQEPGTSAAVPAAAPAA